MSTQASAPHMFSRVAARAGLGLWRNRGGLLLAVLVTAGLAAYASLTWSGSSSTTLAASGLGNSDCADTAMAAIADKSPAAVTRAYQCMDASFQQRVPEQAFVQQMQQQRMPNVDKLARVGDYHAASGGTMVYYAIDGGGQSVGYIVYVGQNGKVLRIE